MKRALDIVEPVLFVGVALAFLLCAVLFARALGGEPVVCPVGSPELSCTPYHQVHP